MTRLRTVIIDDEPLALEMLRSRLESHSSIEIVGAAADGEEGAEVIARVKPDLLFLDIQMPRRSGMSLARSLTEVGDIAVVFITANPVFAAEAFEVEAVDYLLKPVQPERLATAVLRAERRVDEIRKDRLAPPSHAPAQEASQAQEAAVFAPADDRPSILWVPQREGSRPIRIIDIEWIEAARDYVLLHTASHSHMLRTTMENLEEKLDPRQMTRISRSLIVNRACISDIQEHAKSNYVVVLSGGVALKVGPTYIPQLRKNLATFPDRPQG